MSSIGNKRTRCLAWLAAFTGIALSLNGCHYPSEEELWASCCLLSIIKDESSPPDGRRTIIAWQSFTIFGGRGEPSDGREGNPPESWKQRQIKIEVAEFLADDQMKRATDYFIGLGMSCMPTTAVSKDAKSRCEIELPIWIECSAAAISWFRGIPVPKELRQPMPAYLHMSTDVSAESVLDVSTRIDPVPGGHLCHR